MRRKRKKKSLLIWRHLAIILVLISMTLFYLRQRTELLRAGYRLREMMQQEAQLREEKSTLLLESSRLSSPDRIERVAIQELGLVRNPVIREIRRPIEE
jgi:cell division protein FtsL